MKEFRLFVITVCICTTWAAALSCTSAYAADGTPRPKDAVVTSLETPTPATSTAPPKATPKPAATAIVSGSAAVNPPYQIGTDGNGNAVLGCRLVLTTVRREAWPEDQRVFADCNAVPFSIYINSLLNTMLPYVLLFALILIVYSGVQYMAGSITGTAKIADARQRITAILTGVIFFFLVRLILNQLRDNIGLGFK